MNAEGNKSDTDHVRRLQSGDGNAWERFVGEYRRRLVGYFLALGFSADASEDLTQDTFIETVKSINNLRNPDRLTPWLFTIAHRVGMCHLRKEYDSRTWNLEPTPLLHASPGSDPARLRDALASLSPQHRHLLYLRYVLRLSMATISEMCSIRSDTVRKKISRSSALLRVKIQ